VIGNSGTLLDSSYGGIIDNHEVIFRMNQAPVKGYELYVGRALHVVLTVSSLGASTCASSSTSSRLTTREAGHDYKHPVRERV
jgi:hypothetical protein